MHGSQKDSLLFIFSPLGLYPCCLYPVQPRNETSSLEADIRNCRLWLDSRLWNYTEKNFKIKPYTILGKIWNDKCRCKQGKYKDHPKIIYLKGHLCDEFVNQMIIVFAGVECIVLDCSGRRWRNTMGDHSFFPPWSVHFYTTTS